MATTKNSLDFGFGKNNSTYRGADSGCEYMTKQLGYQVKCLECPRKECIFVGQPERSWGKTNFNKNLDK